MLFRIANNLVDIDQNIYLQASVDKPEVRHFFSSKELRDGP